MRNGASELLTGNADVAVGVRGYRAAGWRGMGSRLFSVALWVRTGRWFHDPTCGMRAFRGPALRYFADHPMSEPEQLLVATKLGFRIVEVRISVRPRLHGASSFTSPLAACWFMAKVLLNLFINPT